MDHPSLSSRNSQSRVGRSKKNRPIDLAEVSQEFERKWFELDRSDVIGQTERFATRARQRREADEMIAAERMFHKGLSDEILEKARR